MSAYPAAGVVADAPSYLARDYAGFRQLLLDHLAIALGPAMPTDVASVEVALVEALAYAADQLSYYQDAVATEAHLVTARRRDSVVRHARLLGYRIDEGCAARAWLHVETTADTLVLSAGTAVASRIDGVSRTVVDRDALAGAAAIFETLHPVTLARRRNRVAAASPPTATSIDLVAGAGFAAGDVAIVQPTGEAGWPVRIVRVAGTTLHWHHDDAIVSAPRADSWSVLGNMVLVEHGRGVERILPPGTITSAAEATLACADLAYAVPHDRAASATAALVQDPQATEPCVALVEHAGTTLMPPRAPWRGVRDLIGSRRDSRVFAATPIDRDHVRLRFADAADALRPDPAWTFVLRYRTGGGRHGNVGAGTLAHIVHPDDRIVAVANPLPATGGRDREDVEAARAAAIVDAGPGDRCVTPDDYARAAACVLGVGAAVAARSDDRATIAGRRIDDAGAPAAAWLVARVAAHLLPRTLLGERIDVAAAAVVATPATIVVHRAPGVVAADALAAARAAALAVAPGFGGAITVGRLEAAILASDDIAAVAITLGAVPPPAADAIARIDPATLSVTVA